MPREDSPKEDKVSLPVVIIDDGKYEHNLALTKTGNLFADIRKKVKKLKKVFVLTLDGTGKIYLQCAEKNTVPSDIPAGGEHMVKMIVSIAVSLALLAAAYLNTVIDAQFAQVRSARMLEEKVREENALPADTRRSKLWENKKETARSRPAQRHLLIDYWLGEADGCIEAGLYADALSKIEVLRHL